MAEAPIQTAGRQVWTCSRCNRRFIWGERSSWYGSLRALDEGAWDRIEVYCGECPPPPEPTGGGRPPGERVAA